MKGDATQSGGHVRVQAMEGGAVWGFLTTCIPISFVQEASTGFIIEPIRHEVCFGNIFSRLIFVLILLLMFCNLRWNAGVVWGIVAVAHREVTRLGAERVAYLIFILSGERVCGATARLAHACGQRERSGEVPFII